MRQKVAVLGSTGSIGRQTLEVISALSDRFEVVSLAAGRNVDVLVSQIEAYHPRLVAVADEEAAARQVKGRRNGAGCVGARWPRGGGCGGRS